MPQPADLPSSPAPRRELSSGRGFLLVALAALAVLFARMIAIFLTPVILAIVIATLFYPAYEWLLPRLRGWRGVAAGLTCLLLLAGLLLPLYAMVSVVVDAASDVYDQARHGEFDVMQAQLKTALTRLHQAPWAQRLGLGRLDPETLVTRIASQVGLGLGAILAGVSEGTLRAVASVFIALFAMFYFFRDGRAMVERLVVLVPLAPEHQRRLYARFATVSRATVKGTIILAALQGSIGGLILYGFGVERVAVWTMVMLLLGVVPMLGAWPVLYGAALVKLLDGHPYQALAIALITAAVVSSLDNLLRPRLVGHDAGLHDLMVLLSTLGGISVFGVTGFIVGPVVAALLIVVLELVGEEFHS